MSYDEKHYEEGITRRKNKSNIYEYYYISSGNIITKKDLERIKLLKLPPAWTEVWISRDANSSIQAIGKDIKGRKQYKYHHVHITKSDQEKFIRLRKFTKTLPKFMKILDKHMSISMYNKKRVLATMIYIVKKYYLRVGKDIYVRENKSYGISSLRKRHVHITGDKVVLNFKGKSSQRLNYTINDPDLVYSIKLLLKLDGDRLFQYTTVNRFGHETLMNITDKDLNEYIREYMGEFSIKDFRTYGANYCFIKALQDETKKRTPKNRSIIKKNIVNAFKSTARQLKHTRSISKKSYVMDFALELYQNSPEYFTKNKNTETNELLLDLLKMYKKNILTNDI
jgi:DNA topoisomerase-1